MTLALDHDKQNPSPFVKWAGGKSSLVAELLRHVPTDFSNYYEPFLGGGAFFFALYTTGRKFDAVLSDVNAELVQAYNVVKDRPDELVRVLSKLQDEYHHSMSRSSYYYEKRAWRPTDPIQSAARLIFLNKTCYNGLYRVNSRGEFNVPFGRYANPKILDVADIRAVSDALRKTNAQIQCADYKSTISTCSENDFVYLDPPYQPKTKTSSFTDYTPGGFSQKDQEELAREFRRLVDRGSTVLLSNSETPLTVSLYREFHPKTLTVNRPINSVGTGRTGYRELIVVGSSE
jgi:DNA adenine methylase